MSRTADHIDLAVIGCGYIAIAEHIPSILTSRHARLKAVVEPREDMRALVTERFGVPAFESLSAMREAGISVDAVDICAGAAMHTQLAEEALNAGYHVLIEKPLCHSVTEGRRLVETARARGRHLMVGYMRRYDDDVRTVKRLIDEGAIGEVRAIHTVFKLALGAHFVRPFEAPPRGPAPPPPPAPDDLLPFDQIINQSLHQINMMRYLVGEVASLSGVQKAPGAIHILFNLEGGAVGFHAHVANMGHGEEAFIYGEAGAIAIKLWSPHIPFQFPEVRMFDRARREERLIHTPRLNPYANEIEAFCRIVLGLEEPTTQPEDAVRDLEIIAGIHRVHAAAEPVVI